MAAYGIELHFPARSPTVEQIQLKCCERTGLDVDIRIDYDEENEIECSLLSSEFKRECALQIYDQSVLIVFFDCSYFQWNVVLALIDLGGLVKTELEVLEIVFLPWKERKWWWWWQFTFGGPTRRISAIYDE